MSQPLEVTDPAEGSVDWSRASAHMLNPRPDEDAEAGEVEREQSPSQNPKEFKYRGKTLKVDSETYDVLEGLRREARGANGRLGSELAQTRERLAKLEGVLSTQVRPDEQEPDIKPPDPLLATRDIVAWQAQWDAYNTAKQAQHVRALEEKYRREVREIQERVTKSQRDTEWANRFYSSYSHLDHPSIKPIVSQVYTEHAREFEALQDDPDGAYELLADLTDRRLVEVRTVGKETTADTTPNRRRPPRIESSAGATPGKKVEETPREFSAGSWVARQRLKMSGQEPKK